MRARLLHGQAAGADEEGMGTKQEMQDWMLSVGIASPVTKESAGALYHQQLSREVHFYFYFFQSFGLLATSVLHFEGHM
jgi:hypothetical protein